VSAIAIPTTSVQLASAPTPPLGGGFMTLHEVPELQSAAARCSMCITSWVTSEGLSKALSAAIIKCALRHQPQLHCRSPGAAGVAPHTPCKTEKTKAFSVMLMRSQVSSRVCALRHQPQLHCRSPGAAALAPHSPCNKEKTKAFSVMLMRSQVLYCAARVLNLQHAFSMLQYHLIDKG